MEKIDKIHIEGEGKQIIKLFKEKYRITRDMLIKKYADKLGIYETTINQYLKNKSIKNEKFKKALQQDFGMSYEKAIKTAESQVIYYIETMKREIDQYNEEKDLLNAEELIRLCQQNNLEVPYHRLIAKGNRAMIKLNMGLRNEAKTLLEEVIQEARALNYPDLYIFYTTELAYIHNFGGDYSASRKRLKELEEVANEEKVDNSDILFKYWSIYAKTLESMEMYPIAITKMELAYRYVGNVNQRIEVLLNKAKLYKLDRQYSLAIEEYNKALKESDNHIAVKTIVLDSIAMFCYERNDLEKAKKYINKAMTNMPENLDIENKVNILESVLLIVGEEEIVLKEVIDMLLVKEKTLEDRENICRCLDGLVRKLITKEDVKLMIRLRDQLRLIIMVEDKPEDLKELKMRFADVMGWLMDKGNY